MTTEKLTILFVGSNPVNTPTIAIDQEARAIDLAISDSPFGDRIDFRIALAVQLGDLGRLFRRYQPQVVHFSGHGDLAGTLLLCDSNNNARAVSNDALELLFSLFADTVRCVVLNTAYSEPLGKVIAPYVDSVVYLDGVITDSAAVNFASGFYVGIAFGRSVKTAFDLACSQAFTNDLDSEPPSLIAFRADPASIVLMQEDKKFEELSGVQTAQLQLGLVSAFNPSDLKQMVQIALGENLDAIVGTTGRSHSEVVFDLINWAQRHAKLSLLIQGATATNPDNPALLRFASMLRT